MKKIKQAFSVAAYNFRQWRGNPRIIVTFALAFILCFLLSDKAVNFAVEHNTTMQLVEAFIWTFSDSNSILLSSMLLVLLFADMPFLSSGTPFYLVRTSRKVWVTGQMLYTIAATLASLQKKIGRETIREMIERVGLDPDMKKPVGKYSLGMRQRLGLAQALMEDPQVLILDEPFNGLDKHGAAHIRNLIKSLKGEGKTILLASHNQVDIDELCDTVCEMDGGIMTMVRE